MSSGSTVRPRPAGVLPSTAALTVFRYLPNLLVKLNAPYSLLRFLLVGLHKCQRDFTFFICTQLTYVPRAIGPKRPDKAGSVHQARYSKLYQKRAKVMGDEPALHQQQNCDQRHAQGQR